jgi:hypothetical protein
MDKLIIVLTGSRHEDQYRVDVNGKPVWLQHASFLALVDLVAASIESESGCLPLERSTVYRLRKALGAHVGKKLIERAGDRRYRLTIPKTKVAQQVGVTPCLFELGAEGDPREERAEMLRRHCRACVLSENS